MKSRPRQPSRRLKPRRPAGRPAATCRAGLYARVSTDDRGQDPETQLRQLREYAARRGFEVAGEFVDYASGTRNDRPQFKRLMEAARRRELDVVLVWRYDRFARSTQALVNALMEFRALGVDFISYQENVDTTTPQGELVFGMMASLAQFESSLISERVRAGMARAKAQGKRVSRPPLPEATRRKIEELRRAGKSINAIHKELKIGYGTAWNYVRALERADR
jgi:DNA invertase Pin-like site-specific DNA recombinase